MSYLLNFGTDFQPDRLIVIYFSFQIKVIFEEAIIK